MGSVILTPEATLPGTSSTMQGTDSSTGLPTDVEVSSGAAFVRSVEVNTGVGGKRTITNLIDTRKEISFPASNLYTSLVIDVFSYGTSSPTADTRLWVYINAMSNAEVDSIFAISGNAGVIPEDLLGGSFSGVLFPVNEQNKYNFGQTITRVDFISARAASGNAAQPLTLQILGAKA